MESQKTSKPVTVAIWGISSLKIRNHSKPVKPVTVTLWENLFSKMGNLRISVKPVTVAIWENLFSKMGESQNLSKTSNSTGLRKLESKR
jgi:hypothetical protein